MRIRMRLGPLFSYSGEGNGNPLHYSYLENPMDRGVWRATVHGVRSWQLPLRVCSSPRRLQFKEGLWLLNPQGQARYSDTSWGFNWCLLIPNVFITQLCPPLSDPMDCSPPGSSVHGILQARVLEWVAIPFSRGSSPTQGSKPGLLHCRQILYCWLTQENILTCPVFQDQ